MRLPVVLIDHGMGNLHSVEQALRHVGGEVRRARDADEMGDAERIVLPGVGAFPAGWNGLVARGFVDPLRRHAVAHRPLLGICLGMQLLFDIGHEFQTTPGLGLLRGTVEAIPAGPGRRVPHVGWRSVRPPGDAGWEHPALADLPPSFHAYFLHSFHARPEHLAERVAICPATDSSPPADAGRVVQPICAGAAAGSVLGVQFHPEKSGRWGLAMLAGFLNMPLSMPMFREKDHARPRVSTVSSA